MSEARKRSVTKVVAVGIGMAVVIIGLGVFFSGIWTPAGKNADQVPAARAPVGTDRPVPAAAGPGTDVGSASLGGFAVSDFKPLKYGGAQPAWQGMAGEAYVARKLEGDRFRMTPNQNGEYPRICVDAKETVDVWVAFPRAPSDSQVAVVANDGGVVDGGGLSALHDLDAAKRLYFQFTSSENDGTHRVSLRLGQEQIMLDFWVGAEHPPRKR